MANKKIKDLTVKTGSYTDRNGQEKATWLNIGSIWKGDKGSWMLINRSFNPAGVPFKDGGDSVMVSMFDPKEKDEQGANAPKQGKAAPAPADDLNDDIPF